MEFVLDQLWAIHEGYVPRVGDCLSAPANAVAGLPAMPAFELIADGVALVEVSSVLHKGWWASTPLPTIAKNLKAAADNPNVAAILLAVDSPGGTVAGTADVADAVNYARSKKPVFAHVQDLAASAAYWISSQAEKVFTNQPSALVGSIGTYGVLYDTSKMADKLGVKVHVVRAGEHKGAGEFGTEITAAQLAEAQNRIDAINSHFIAGVSAGRRMSPDAVRAIADGRVYLASVAQSNGLIDGIKTLDAVVAELVSAARERKQPATRHVMSTAQVEGPKAATLAELKTACPGAPSDWILGQLEAGATVSAAQAAFIAAQQAEIVKAKADAAKAAEEAKSQQSAGLGVAPLGTTGDNGSTGTPLTGNAVADFNSLVRQEMRDNGGDRMKAANTVARQNPTAHKAYLLATNPKSQHDAIENKFAAR